jgi:hypothetical protein
VPLIYSERSRLERGFADDGLWQKIAQRQPEDISELRFVDVGSADWVRATTKIAEVVEDILADDSLGESAPKLPSALSVESQSGDGFLERFADLEGRAPRLVQDMELFTELLGQLGEVTTAATPKMDKAKSFSQKLAITNSLASSLSPIATTMRETSQSLVDNFSDWDALVAYVIIQAKTDETFSSEPGNVEFLSTVHDMATAGVESLSGIEELQESIGSVLGMSKRLDIPLRTIREACLHVADLRGLLTGWKSELEALEETS